MANPESGILGLLRGVERNLALDTDPKSNEADFQVVSNVLNRNLLLPRYALGINVNA